MGAVRCNMRLREATNGIEVVHALHDRVRVRLRDMRLQAAEVSLVVISE
jgi:hypothetical protein